MDSNYIIIKQLIDLLIEFEAEKPQQAGLLNFAEWIVKRIREEPDLNKEYTARRVHSDYSEHFAYVKILDEKARFLEYISRIARFHEFYLRKFLDELPVNSRLEYLFLFTVNRIGKAKKTDLISIHLVEYTTGMDTIRRLVNNGFLEENPDENDKRVKLLSISKKGKRVLVEADKKIADERNMFLACISPNKWKKTLPVLEELNDFHNMIYLNHNDKTSAELSNLMDSLKHIYK